MPDEVTQEELKYLKEMLQSDLETLFHLTFTFGQPVKEGDIRVSSAILRKWLIDGLIGRLCRALGAKPKFVILDNYAVIEAISRRSDITYFLTGGVRFNGRAVYGIYSSDAPAPPYGPVIPVDKMEQRLVRQRDFLEQKRVFFEGDYFSTAEIIKFVANKLGGVHHDMKRTVHHERLERAADFMTFGGHVDNIVRGVAGEMHLLLEPDATEALTGLHIEIVAAAAAFISIHIDDTQLMPIEVHRSLKEKVRAFIVGQPPPQMNIITSAGSKTAPI